MATLTIESCILRQMRPPHPTPRLVSRRCGNATELCRLPMIHFRKLLPHLELNDFLLSTNLMSIQQPVYSSASMVYLMRDRIDNSLHAACNARRAERKQEFPGPILDHLFGVDILEYVNAVEHKPLEPQGASFLSKGITFKVCRVRPNHSHFERRPTRSVVTEMKRFIFPRSFCHPV